MDKYALSDFAVGDTWVTYNKKEAFIYYVERISCGYMSKYAVNYVVPGVKTPFNIVMHETTTKDDMRFYMAEHKEDPEYCLNFRLTKGIV